MKRKYGFLCLALVLALGTMGIGYAAWTDTIFINGDPVLTFPSDVGARGKVGFVADENPGTYFDNLSVDFL